MKLIIAAICGAAVVCLVGGDSPVENAESASQSCRQSIFKRSAKSILARSTLLRVSMTVTWCFNGRRVTKAQVTCKIDEFDRVTIQVDSCQTQGRTVPWNGYDDGGFYAQTSSAFSNCVFRYGCWQSAIMNIERWLYADGIVSRSSR